MTMEEICALPVEQMAARDAHLWLWTTWNFLWSAPRVALSWGFQPSYLLTWAKPEVVSCLAALAERAPLRQYT